MKILLASNNRHKLQEMNGILRHLTGSIDILTPRDIGFSIEIAETGHSFGENAMIKAQALWAYQKGEDYPKATSDTPSEAVGEMTRRMGGPFPVLSDDSGISVHAFGGAPGVYSARYGSDVLGPESTDRDRTDLLLARMNAVTDRRAYYTCNAVLVLSDTQYVQVQDTWNGEIGTSYVEGTGGFGYDPIFYLPDYESTVSQLPQVQKDRISHRAKAVKAVLRGAALLSPLT